MNRPFRENQSPLWRDSDWGNTNLKVPEGDSAGGKFFCNCFARSLFSS
jgi:hypothetical protein